MTRFISLLMVLLTLPVLAALPPVEYFAKANQADSVKISPKGDYLAMLTKADGKQVVAIVDTESLEFRHVVRYQGSGQIGAYYWASNDRLVTTMEYLKGWIAEPQNYGELVAVDFNGKRPVYLFGYRSASSIRGGLASMRRARPIQAWGKVIDSLPEDEDHILIQSTPMNRKGDKRPTVFRVNINSGKRTKVASSPVGFANFITDHDGEVRFVVGIDDEGMTKMYYREGKKSDWTLFWDEENAEGSIIPVSFASKDEVYVLDSSDHSLQGLKKVNLKTGDSTLIYRNDVVNPQSLKFSADGRHLYALEVAPGYPGYVFVDPQSADATSLKGLLAAFPGMQVKIVSQTLDGNLMVVFVRNDTDPGTYYLFNREKNKARALIARRGWVDTEASATVEPFSFEARDGMTIYGYLTIPAGKEAKDLPLVVNPHGGPHGVRDYWRYDQEAQMLASRGMAVLQVNFRGSGGYGRHYELAGYGNWGSKIQYDIIDATRHMIEQGKVDKDNICVFGGSFGGYSALQAPIVEPGLFKCAIGFAGVYDLELMYEIGDIPEHKYGVRYLKDVIGEDKENMKAFSPVHNVDKLKIPLLIIHGGEDERVPIEHAEALRKALDQHKHPYKWVELNKEGHGLFDEETRIEVYGEILSFLDDNLKL